MKLKRFGKRVLFLTGGILIIFISSIVLAVYIEDGGQLLSQGVILLCIAIVFGIALIIDSFSKRMNGRSNPRETLIKKANDITRKN